MPAFLLVDNIRDTLTAHKQPIVDMDLYLNGQLGLILNGSAFYGIRQQGG